MEVRQYLTENEHLLRKHSRMISAVNKALKENANYGRELDEFKKANLAVMLENVSHAFDVRKKLTEAQGTQVGDIAKKNDYLNLISAVMPTLVAEDLVNVQPLKQKAGVVYYLKNVFDDDKGGISKGDVISSFERVYVEDSKLNSAFNYSAETVDSEALTIVEGSAKLAWIPVVPGSVVIGTDTDDGEGHIGTATIDYETGVITGLTDQTEASYKQDLYQAPIRVPRVKTIVTDITVTARPRKLATAFSLDAAYDLQMTQNVDLQSIIAGAATDEIRSEIDGEILNDLANSGTSMTISWNQPVPFGISKFDHYESFYQTIVEGANKIYAKTRRITGNFVIVGENAANVIETHSKFKAAASLNEAGPHVAGTLNGKYLVVKNPYFDADQFVIGYNGDTPWDGGYVYAPYMAITSTQFIMGENFLGTQGYATSYAKKLLSGNFYVNGTITHITE
ncbi:MAG: hypothetical protein J6T15_05035 [Bacilli bacterium]|nr:hypothetical protein [Bacilli bacterium]